jgi:DNA polymerase-3 subunit alpha
MFSPDCKTWINLYKEAVSSLEEVVELCNFEYDTKNRRLPKYEMTPEEEKDHGTKDKLFIHLIKKGFKERNIDDPQKYMDRLKEELRVLQKGDVIDYFLVLYDIIQFAKRENILVGIGRGSAGGSLVSYLLGIIQVNPLDFDLLFERFLNDGRMGFIGECRAFEINGDVTLNEGSIIKIERDEKEMIIFVEDLIEGDNILKY